MTLPLYKFYFASAFLTFPERMHAVQTKVLRTLSSTNILTRFTFGVKVRPVALWEWLIVLPLVGAFPQIVHFDILICPPKFVLLKLDLYHISGEKANVGYKE